MKNVTTYVGVDAHKKNLFIAMLVGDQATPVTWQLPNEPNAVRRLVRKLEREAPGPVRMCYEAGPCGYALQRQVTTPRVSCQNDSMYAFCVGLPGSISRSVTPPAHAAVFCVEEKPQIQALDRTQPLLPMQPGQVERRTHDYKRHGTTTLFAALNAKTSEVITQFHQRHRSAQFREFLDLIDARVPRRLDVHIIMDNYSTHKTPLIRN